MICEEQNYKSRSFVRFMICDNKNSGEIRRRHKILLNVNLKLIIAVKIWNALMMESVDAWRDTLLVPMELAPILMNA